MFWKLVRINPTLKKNIVINVLYNVYCYKHQVDLLHESGYIKKDINRFCEDFKNIFREQTEESLKYIKNEEKVLMEKISNS